MPPIQKEKKHKSWWKKIVLIDIMFLKKAVYLFIHVSIFGKYLCIVIEVNKILRDMKSYAF